MWKEWMEIDSRNNGMDTSEKTKERKTKNMEDEDTEDDK